MVKIKGWEKLEDYNKDGIGRWMNNNGMVIVLSGTIGKESKKNPYVVTILFEVSKNKISKHEIYFSKLTEAKKAITKLMRNFK